MVLLSDSLKVIHVSTHCSLKKACENVKKERVIDVIELSKEVLRNLGIKEPRIVVAGLNPHAGERGLFGLEEIQEIVPAIKDSLEDDFLIDGPEAPDTVFLKASEGKYDMVVAMYHDQGHIPMKLLAFDEGVNMTAGLPIIRTSVDHGTAFDIVGKNMANKNSLVCAIRSAMKLSGVS